MTSEEIIKGTVDHVVRNASDLLNLDLNKDGKIDINDFIEVIKEVAEDGQVNIGDLLRIGLKMLCN